MTDGGLSQHSDGSVVSVPSPSLRLMDLGHSWIHVRHLLYPTKLRLYTGPAGVYHLIFVYGERKAEGCDDNAVNCLNDQLNLKVIIKPYTYS